MTTTEAYKTTIEHLSDIKNYVGQEIGLSEWIEITQERIDNFADVTEDHQWIHINPEMAAQYSPYKTTIAHGFLVLSLAPKISYEVLELQNVAMGVNYGLNKVRFTNAVPAGAFVRGRLTMKDYREVPGGVRYVINMIIELKGQEKPACVAEWIGQAYAGSSQQPKTVAPTTTNEIAEKENNTVLYKKAEKVATITLNRPKRYNAINTALLEGLLDNLDKARADKSVKAIVLTGNGKGFCAGADMSVMGNLSPKQTRDYLNMYYGSVVRRIVEMDKPVIAAINGPVAGAGLGIALACDFRVMATTASMRYAFINIALAPDAGSGWFLTRLVGYSKALEIAIAGEKIPAATCLKLGLTNKMVASDQLLETTLAWAKRLAARPMLAFAATKRDLQYSMTHRLFDSLAFEAEQQMACLASYDHKEGVTAFLQKRKPKFIGK